MSPSPSSDDTRLPIVLLAAALPDPAFVAGPGRDARARTGALAALARDAVVVRQAFQAEAVPAELGHEAWLRHRFGLADAETVAASAVLGDAPDLRPGAGGPAAWRVDPVHLHVGTDHLVLTDPAGLHAEHGARELAAAVAPLFGDEGLVLAAPSPSRWILHETDARRPLRVATRSLLAALGRSIEMYLPRGDDARRWKRLLNETQMTWHEHPANRDREAAGLLPINGLWLAGRVPARSAATAALARIATLDGEALAVSEVETPDGVLHFAGHLLAAQCRGDPQAWHAAWEVLDSTLLERIAKGAAPFARGARLVLTGDDGWREIELRCAPRWRFWRRGADPAALLAPGPHPTAGGPAPTPAPARARA